MDRTQSVLFLSVQLQIQYTQDMPMHKAHISSFDIWLSFHKRLPRVNIHFVRRMLASGRGGGEGGEGGEGGTATKSFAAFSPDLFLLIDIL